MSSPYLEIRLFYVRISPCSISTAPPSLTLTHLRRPLSVSLQINGSKIPSSESTTLTLRRDRIDSDASEATYVCTDTVRLTGPVDFEVTNQETLILCGSLEKMEMGWSNGSVGPVKDANAGWGMDVCVNNSGFGGRKGGMSPSVEVYVAGCFGGKPLILTQTVQMSPRKKGCGGLDSIPEDEEGSGGGKENGLVSQRIMGPVVERESDDEYDSDTKVGPTYYPEGWYMDEDGQLSWFNAGVRVGVGIGLGMCVGVGIGVGLLMRSYQATTRGFKRRFF